MFSGNSELVFIRPGSDPVPAISAASSAAQSSFLTSPTSVNGQLDGWDDPLSSDMISLQIGKNPTPLEHETTAQVEYIQSEALSVPMLGVTLDSAQVPEDPTESVQMDDGMF